MLSRPPNKPAERLYSATVRFLNHSSGAARAAAADILQDLCRNNVSCRVFDSGLAISLFRDQSTRTRFSFASAANFLGLALQDLDEGKSQIAHGETVRETANMVSFMAEVIGIRDDMYIGRGNAYMREVAAAVQQGYEAGILEQRPTVINLQCDIDHPTQSMSDMLHLFHTFGGSRKAVGQKDRHVLGLLALLRQTPFRSTGCSGLDDPFWDERGAVASAEGREPKR